MANKSSRSIGSPIVLRQFAISTRCSSRAGRRLRAPRSRVETRLSRDGPTEPERSGRHPDDGPGGPPAAAGATGSDPERNGGRPSRPSRRGGAVAGGLLRGVGAGDGGDGATAGHDVGRLGGELAALPDSMPPPASCGRAEGYSLHAGVRVAAGDRPRLEKLCRYVARPALALDRLQELADGRFAYRLRHAWSNGTETLIFEPGTVIETLVALVPRPNGHLTRFHGVLAPRSSWRAAIVPRPAVRGEVASRARERVAVSERASGRTGPCCCPGCSRSIVSSVRGVGLAVR